VRNDEVEVANGREGRPAGTRVGRPTESRPRTCGVRFSAFDAVFLVVGAVATALIWPVDSEAALLVPFTVGHFFLFCNVFRISRRSELIWAAVLVLNAVAWHLAAKFSPLGIIAAQLPLTALLLWLETRRPSYHGIACRRWNSEHVDAYLRGEVEP